MNTPPFVTYERTVRQTKKIALVTAENIGQIAQLIEGSVDYSGGDPVLIVRSSNKPWKVKVGSHVQLLGGDPPSISNANGFNHDGEWTETAADPFPYRELSMLLHADHGPKTFCPARLVGPAGWRVANCTREQGHTPPHVDCHEGTRWT